MQEKNSLAESHVINKPINDFVDLILLPGLI